MATLSEIDPVVDGTHRTVLLWLADAGGMAEFFSPSWTAFCGQTQSDLLGMAWYEHIYRDDQAALSVAIEKAVATGSGFRLHLRLRRHDGEHVPFACEGIPRQGIDGNFSGLIGICTDVLREERAHAEADLAGRHFVDLLPQSDLVALAVDDSGRVLFFNQALTRLLGNPAGETGVANALQRLLDRQHRSLAERLFPNDCRIADFPARFETEFIDGCEGRQVFLWYSIPLRDYLGHHSGVVLIGDNFTERSIAEERLRVTARVFETTNLAMLITDRSGAILSANNAFTQLTGYDMDEVIGRNPRILQSGRHDRAFYLAMWETISRDGRWQGEVWDKRKDGSIYPKLLSISTLKDDHGETTHYSGIFYDISERKLVEDRLRRLAHFDALTELPNRLFFEDSLALACHHAAINDERFALLFIDLDHFKEVNDTLGHQAGDELLRETGRRLRLAVRSQDMAARIGGDEFAVILADIKGPENVAMVAKKILEAFVPAVEVGPRGIKITPSIGIALCPDDAADPETLLRLADEAMYRTKAAGRNGYAFWAVPG